MSKERIKSIALLGLITFFVVYFSVNSCNRQAEKIESKTFDSTSIFKTKLEALQKQGETQAERLKSDSLKTSIALNALKRENKTLKKKLADMRPDITRIADSIPILDTFMGLTDSLDLVQEATIDTLENEKARIWKTMNGLVFNCKEQVQLLNELADHKEAVNNDLRKQVKRERRKKTMFKVISGFLVGVVVYLAVE